MHLARFAVLGAAILAALTGTTGPLSAHEGHDHGAEQRPPADLRAAPRAEAASDAFEVVAIADGSVLAIHVDRFATNEPVTGASVEVEAPDGPAVAREEHPGRYEFAAPWLARPGRYDLIVTVTLAAAVDVLPLTLTVPEPEAAAASARTGQWSAGYGVLAAAAAAGFVLGVLLMRGRRARRTATAPVALIGLGLVLVLFAGTGLAHEGEDHGPAQKPTAPPIGRDLSQRLADGGVFMPKPAQRLLAIRTVLAEQGVARRTIELPGRIVPDPNASGYVQASVGGRLSPAPGGFPRLGQAVKAGDVLAFVTPPLQAIDISDMRQRQGEIEQQMSIVERRVARYETLVTSGAVSRTQLEEARLELEGLRQRRAALETIRREPEALVAPVAGVVADGSAVAGQIVQPNAVVFHIVDPARLFVEALSFDVLPAVKGASARSASRSFKLAFQGAGFADRNQSIPVHFAVSDATAGLRVGQLVTVFVTTGEEHPGIALPRSAIVRGASGQDLVYLHTAAERFEPRPVRFAPLDGARVLVTAGIESGARVVTQGAELIDQVR